MHDRSSLGVADVSEARLTAMVADLLGSDPAATTLLSSSADVFPYELQAITTAGRFWVSGTASVEGHQRSWRMFVKHIQSWSRSPLFVAIPPEHRAMAEASVPWRTEALAYRSDLADRLPDGLRMPRALGVFDLDDLSATVWLEEVPVADEGWTLPTYAEAARLLGQLAASPDLAGLAGVGRHEFDIRTYRDGRLALQVLPMLRDEGVWRHPLVADTFDETTRARLLAAGERAHDLVEEVMALPMGLSHGDACPNNLLRSPGVDGFVLIDFGFWGGEPLGFDLSQLLVGDVQVGRRSADDLREVEEVILPAYVDGLRDQGCQVAADVVRRAHALQLMIFTGFSCVPVEHFGSEPTPELHRIAAQRAAIARFSLDLLDESEALARVR